MEEKAEASEVFKRGWEMCRADEGYGELKREFQREQREWDKAAKEGRVKVEEMDEGGDGDVKEETVAKKEEEEEVKVKEESEEG
jgi:Skp family chaperone for outer membrane proteins